MVAVSKVWRVDSGSSRGLECDRWLCSTLCTFRGVTDTGCTSLLSKVEIAGECVECEGVTTRCLTGDVVHFSFRFTLVGGCVLLGFCCITDVNSLDSCFNADICSSLIVTNGVSLQV